MYHWTGQAVPLCLEPPVVEREPSSPVVITEQNATICLFWQIRYCGDQLEVHLVSKDYNLYPIGHTNPSEDIINYTANVSESTDGTLIIVNVTLVITMSETVLDQNFVFCKIWYSNVTRPKLTEEIYFKVQNETTTPSPTTTDCPPSFATTEDDRPTVTPGKESPMGSNSDACIRPFLFLLSILQCTVLLLFSTISH